MVAGVYGSGGMDGGWGLWVWWHGWWLWVYGSGGMDSGYGSMCKLSVSTNICMLGWLAEQVAGLGWSGLAMGLVA